MQAVVPVDPQESRPSVDSLCPGDPPQEATDAGPPGQPACQPRATLAAEAPRGEPNRERGQATGQCSDVSARRRDQETWVRHHRAAGATRVHCVEELRSDARTIEVERCSLKIHLRGTGQ